MGRKALGARPAALVLHLDQLDPIDRAMVQARIDAYRQTIQESSGIKLTADNQVFRELVLRLLRSENQECESC